MTHALEHVCDCRRGPLPFVELSESGASSIGNIVLWLDLDPRDAGAAACVHNYVRATAFESDTIHGHERVCAGDHDVCALVMIVTLGG